MSRHDGRKRSELEIQIGMAGRDHFMIHEFFASAQVTGEALLRAMDEIARVVHARFDGLLMSPAASGVRAQPVGRRPVTALATHAVRRIERASTLIDRNIERMAGEALR